MQVQTKYPFHLFWSQTFWNSWLSILSMTPNFLFLFFNVIFWHKLRIHPRSINESQVLLMAFSRLFFALGFNLLLFSLTIVFTEVSFFFPIKFLCACSTRWALTAGKLASIGWASSQPASSTWTTQYSRWPATTLFHLNEFSARGPLLSFWVVSPKSTWAHSPMVISTSMPYSTKTLLLTKTIPYSAFAGQAIGGTFVSLCSIAFFAIGGDVATMVRVAMVQFSTKSKRKKSCVNF